MMGLSPSNPGVHAREITLPLTSFNSSTGGSGGTRRHRKKVWLSTKKLTAVVLYVAFYNFAGQSFKKKEKIKQSYNFYDSLISVLFRIQSQLLQVYLY